jgi:molecular chaperone GrpE
MTKKKSETKKRGQEDTTPEASAPPAPEASAGAGQTASEAPGPEPTEPGTPPAPAAPPIEDQQLLRLRADFENYRKRVLREKDELYRRANTDLVTELLPVLDHLDIAFAAADANRDDAVVQGFRLVGDQMRSVMERFGLKPVDAQGQAFDHNLHEAVAQLPSADIPENHVIAQTRRGYLLGDRLLRAAQVVVSSGPPAA